MSLERFRRGRMVVLSEEATAYQAARAMADNHIGAVLVSGPSGLAGIVTDRDLALAVIGCGMIARATPLHQIMSENVAVCDIGADVDEAVRLMREHGVRRIPLVENGQPVGLVTFDDLVVDGSVSLEKLQSIVTAQLEVEAPLKPAGMLHPGTPASAQARTRALMRAKARAEATYGRMLHAVAEKTGLERGPAERALLVATSMLCCRLTPHEAQDFIAQLPSLLQAQLDRNLGAMDRSVSTQTIEEEMARTLDVAPERAREIIRGVFEVIAENVSAGEIEQVRGQLPQEMKSLLPATALSAGRSRAQSPSRRPSA